MPRIRTPILFSLGLIIATQFTSSWRSLLQLLQNLLCLSRLRCPGLLCKKQLERSDSFLLFTQGRFALAQQELDAAGFFFAERKSQLSVLFRLFVFLFLV